MCHWALIRSWYITFPCTHSPWAISWLRKLIWGTESLHFNKNHPLVTKIAYFNKNHPLVTIISNLQQIQPLRVRNTPCRLGQIYLDLTKALQGGV